MLKFAILLSTAMCTLGVTVPEAIASQLDGRIYGGQPTTISSFPWQVSIQHFGEHSCGGSIYSATIIITAAHCVVDQNPSEYAVRAGATDWNTGVTLIQVAAFNSHEDFNFPSSGNDIAVVRLSSPLSFSSYIKPIKLAVFAPNDGTDAVVSGWGRTVDGFPIQLRYADVNIISLSKCASSAYEFGSAVKETMICAAAPERDACIKDSGGPLVSGGELVGVVSWGAGCALSQYPGVYADVAALRNWIIDAANGAEKISTFLTSIVLIILGSFQFFR